MSHTCNFFSCYSYDNYHLSTSAGGGAKERQMERLMDDINKKMLLSEIEFTSIYPWLHLTRNIRLALKVPLQTVCILN